MKTILVTGGAGFIGSHLCASLLKDGNKVICVDDLCTGELSNIKELMKNKNFKFIKHDIIKPFNVRGKIDEIYNLASPASPKAYQDMPLKTLFTNSTGLHNMLILAHKHKAKILHASTSEVYGDPKVSPQSEDYYGYVNPTGPRSCYDESKRFSESLLINFSHKYGIDAKIVRIFNTYGPKMKVNDGRAVPNFIYQCLKNIDITIYGNGNQTRSFCYISDMVDGLKKLMASPINAEPVNLGNPYEYCSIIQLAERIKKLTRSNSKLIYDKLPKDDPIKRKPSIEKAKRLLKWNPKVKMEEGLQFTIKWFKKNLDGGSE